MTLALVHVVHMAELEVLYQASAEPVLRPELAAQEFSPRVLTRGSGSTDPHLQANNPS